MTIRPAAIEDLARLQDLAREFYKCSRFFRGFDIEKFAEFWGNLITAGIGVIFLLVDDEDTPLGAIGGITMREPYSDTLAASEFFWFTHPDHRGSGLHLYNAFERWAKEQGASQIRMCHMLDSMPGKLAIVYHRLGYVPAEVHYVKEL